MNHIYRVIFNRTRGCMQVVAEITHSHGKRVCTAVQSNILKPVANAFDCFVHSQLVTVLLLLGLLPSAMAAPFVLNSGQDIYTHGLNAGKYDLLLGGNVTWNTQFTTNTLANSIITIDGAGNTITASSTSGQRFLDMNYNNSNIAIKNTIITAPGFLDSHSGLFRNNAGSVTSTLNFDGTTFLDIGPTNYTAYNSADYGPIINMRSTSNGNMTISGGTNGVIFKGNHALADAPGAVGIYGQNTMNFTGPVTFDSNYTANYGGALAVYEVSGSKVNFQGAATFTNNHASIFGGAMDLWGGNNSTVTFNSDATFTGNYIYEMPTFTANYPNHINERAAGGAINIGFVDPGANSSGVVFNGNTTITNNFVNNMTNGQNAFGGAISTIGGNYYTITFNGPTVISDNYVYNNDNTKLAHGGAIYLDTAGASGFLTITGNSNISNNYAKNLGGAIYLNAGQININALTGNIIFQGNRQAASFSSYIGPDGSSTFYKPINGSGTPNDIYIGGMNGSLYFNASVGNSIDLYDSILTASNSTMSINKTGVGSVVIHGNAGDSSYNSNVYVNTNVNAGIFSLADTANYGNTTTGSISVANGATLQGGGSSTASGKGITFSAGAFLAANGGTFILNPGASGLNVPAGTIIKGFGLISSPTITLSGPTLTQINATTGNALTMDMIIAGAPSGGIIFGNSGTDNGTVILNKQNTYSGSVNINNGTLQAGTTNILQSVSSTISLQSTASFDLNNFDQSVSQIAAYSGSTIKLGTATLTLNQQLQTGMNTFLSGTGNLVKQGTATTMFTGQANLSGANSTLQVSSGTFIVNGGNFSTTKNTINSGASESVIGSAGRLTATGDISVGAVGSGSLSVDTGAKVFANNIYLATGTAGTLNISAANSLVDVAGNVLVTNNAAAGVSSVTVDTGSILKTLSLQHGPGANAKITLSNGSTLRAGGNNATFISGFGANDFVLGTGGGIIDSNSFDVGTNNIFSGAGTLTKTGLGTLSLMGANTYTGSTTINNGVLRLNGAGTLSTAAVSITAAGTLFVDAPAAGNYTFSNALSGSGILQVGLSSGSNTFAFGAGAGGSFLGTVALGSSSYTLSGTNTSTVAGSTLQLNTGNTTTVGAGTQNIGKLAMNGGKLMFSNLGAAGIINGSGVLTLTSGTVAIDPTGLVNSGGNILQQDEGSNFSLIKAGSVSGSAANLSLTNLGGSAISAVNSNIVQSSNTVAIGAYGFSLSNDATNLYTRYTLSQLDLQPSQVLTLSGDTLAAGANDLSVKMVGSGNLAVNATNTISLSNSNSTYTGSTTVNSGTLLLGADYALGNTSGLTLNNSALTNLNGKTQAIGTLNSSSATATFNVNGGNLTLNNGGTFAGILSGTTGDLTLAGGTLIATGNNTYTGTNTINSGATLQIGSAGTVGSYAGNITDNGTLRFNRSNALTYAGLVSGTGNVATVGTGTITLTGINTYTGGTSISGTGSLVITQGGGLGSGLVTNNGTSLILNFSTNETVSNPFAGTGSLVKNGVGTATLTETGSSQGAINVNAGTLDFAQSGLFNATSYSTASGATSTFKPNATLTLTGALTQNSGATLNVALGGTLPFVNAGSASLNGVLNVTGFSASQPTSSSQIAAASATILHTTGGISGNFSSTNLSANSAVDYLMLGGRVSGNDYVVGYGLNWNAGTTVGNGIFTLTDPADTFTVDTVLANQSASATGWNGTTLTKNGAGTLILSAANTYTGATTINAGTLQAGIANTFAPSSAVSVASGATLDLNNFNQTANNLSGAGQVLLGSAVLTANNSANTTLSGVLSGSGSLTKTGASALTLSGTNTYSGGTTISAGTLVATHANALGAGAITDNGTLQLDFATNGTLANALSGSGTLTKTGVGAATLSATGSTVGAVSANTGTLNFAQNGAFNAASFATATGATTTLAANATVSLSGAMTQNSGATLNIALGGAQPAITANTASLNGALNVTGFSASQPTSASLLSSTLSTLIQTTSGITGNFSAVNLGGASSTVDYLRLAGGVNGNNYNVGYGLTWQAGTTFANGIFTLTNAPDTFNADVVLANQAASATGWNGTTLTQNGLGTLILSSANTYTGATALNGGTLQAGIANTIASSSAVNVASGATFDLNSFNQTANNLSGAGNVALGTATLTANNSGNTLFSGAISGAGALHTTGSGTLTLSGANTYSGGSTLDNTGNIIVTQGSALGSGAVANNSTALILNFAGNETLANVLSGTGNLVKNGLGDATVTGAGSTQTAVTVNAGTLTLAQNGAFNTTGNYTTAAGATTSVGSNGSVLNVGNIFTQQAGSTLSVAISSTPEIIADSAVLGGTLDVSGFDASSTIDKASLLASGVHTVIQTTNGITGDFGSIPLPGSNLDYLIVSGFVSGDQKNYNLGSQLSWTANNQALSSGTFTLEPSTQFDMDLALSNQTISGGFTSGWDGQSLTKEGAGNLILSALNSYTGTTTLNGGTLQTGIADALTTSSAVAVNTGATLDLDSFNQTINNLSGAGAITLGSATLTANSNTNTTFAGVISGTGMLNTTGSGTFTLSGANTYSGGTTIANSGNLIITHGNTLGTGAVANNGAGLVLNFASDETFANTLSGAGTLSKTGAGIATLTSASSAQGAVSVTAGTLQFTQNGIFGVTGNYTTGAGATTVIGDNASYLNIGGQFIQQAGAHLSVAVGSNPDIVADTAILNGTVTISGFDPSSPINQASQLAASAHTLIQTTNGITGNFTNNPLSSSNLDYLVSTGYISVDLKNYNLGLQLAWNANDQTYSSGTFTLQSGVGFDVDMVLADQTVPGGGFTTGWNGQSLTKNGAGELILSALNTYSGATAINAGTLQAGIANTIASSSAVSVASGATFDLNSFNQTANDLSGTGAVMLGSATLIANSNTNTTFGGVISGAGVLNTTGAGTLTLTGINSYTGGTVIDNTGNLEITHGTALGSGTVTNNSDALILSFATSQTLANQLTGSGSLIQNGPGNATLTAAGSSEGDVIINAGALNFAQNGGFTANNLTTNSGATAALAANATLSVNNAFTQSSGSTLNLTLGGSLPFIAANTASLNGTLNLNGFSALQPTRASQAPGTVVTLIQTTGGITGDFSSVNLNGATSSADYLTLGTGVRGNNYDLGYGLTWLGGTTLGNGTFTLNNSSDSFDVDIVLADQSVSATGWDGKTLTKNGAGTLIFSAANSYTGATLINAGTLQAGIANAFANSSAMSLASGATLDANNFNQTANNLSGAGHITLGSATLTLNNSTNSAFSGVVSGSGSLAKTGASALTLSGANSYSGGTSISAGTLVATNASALGTGSISNSGTLQLDFAGNGSVTNSLSGSGALNKTGAGTATLTAASSSEGAVTVSAGGLTLAGVGAFNATDYINNATTTLNSNVTLNLSGALSQSAGGILKLFLGTAQPVISADTASLNGTLDVVGFSASQPTVASQLLNTITTLIHTTSGISGNFSSVNFGGAASSVDYLKLATGVNGQDYNVGYGLTWQAGNTQGNGIFTLTNLSNVFNVDVALANQAASATGWNGQSLTKNGAGELILSALNTYSGATAINAGTLQAGIANTIASSSAVSVASGATFDLNSFNQTANDLSGTGAVTLGSATLIANSNTNTTFGGVISGAGVLNTTGAGTLTLTGINSYTGGTVIDNTGNLEITHGTALGSGTVTNNSDALILSFATSQTLANQLTGSGSLIQNGPGNATLTAAGSSEGDVIINAGALNFAQNGGFTANNLTTNNGATAALAANATLSVNNAFTQSSGSTLNLTLGGSLPFITANTASLNGTLNLSGFSALQPTRASQAPGTVVTLIQTTGGITGDFSSVNLNGATSSADYLTLGTGVRGNNYDLGYGLTWLGGTTLGNGTFTLNNSSDSFDVDIVLADQSASATGWDGKTLTKNGAGTLIFSAANSYTGATLINAGTLQAGIANAFANSSAMSLASGATLDANNFNQTANNLSGAGHITLGSATLTLNNSTNSAFSGVVSGSGSLVKTGASALTLSGANSYSGGTSISAGTLVATNASALGTGSISNSGTLQLDFAGNGSVTNSLSGSGALNKTGAGTATLTAASSSEGAVTVSAGGLTLAGVGAFNATDYINNATTTLNSNVTLNLSGALSQSAGGILQVALGGTQPFISANTANLDGALDITGLPAAHSSQASALPNGVMTILHTTGGITGDFSNVNLNGAVSNVDYITLTEGVNGNDYQVGYGLTWLAGANLGDGQFTQAQSAGTFNVDVVLANQAASATGWDGQSLTKNGTGTIMLSAVNTYSGATTINDGTLTMGTVDALASSNAVTIKGSGMLNLNGFNQRVNDLSGVGGILLNGADLTANNLNNTTFSGVMTGDGQLIKTGAGILTLTGTDLYSGGTTISEGTLVATQSSAVGDGTITNDGTLDLAFAQNGVIDDVVAGANGSFNKTEEGTATLSATGSNLGAASVLAGTLTLAADTVTSANSYVVASEATSSMLTDAFLNVTGQVDVEGTLSVTAGANLPSTITSDTSTIGSNATLNFEGYSAPATASATELADSHFVLIQTAAPGNLTGSFANVTIADEPSPVDFLSVTQGHNNQTYTIGLGLTWYASNTATPQKANGTFTLNSSIGAFNLDVPIFDQVANSSNGWDGKTLTKEGLGTLTLSSSGNTYTGATQVNAGTLQAGIVNAFVDSSAVTVASEATLDLNNFDQQVNNLAGAGTVILGTATMTTNATQDTIFSGEINGYGNLVKNGANTLVLSGNNGYQGSTTIDAGTLSVGDGGVSGSLASNTIINHAALVFNLGSSVATGLSSSSTAASPTIASSTYAGLISGEGTLTKEGVGELILSGNNTYTGTTTVNGGILALSGSGTIADSSAATLAQAGAVLDVSAVSGTSSTVQNLSGVAGSQVKLAGKTLTIQNSQDTVYAGDVDASTGGITKTGTGQLTLSGQTGWTGITNLNGGTLTLDGSAGGAQLTSNVVGMSGTQLNLDNGASLTGSIDPTDVTIRASSIWNMTGNSLVDNLVLNGGSVNFVAPTTGGFKTLTINQALSGSGNFVMNTNLGAQQGDLLMAQSTTGSHSITIHNQGGAPTAAGQSLKIIQVGGPVASQGHFSLTNGYVDAGAYRYVLTAGADFSGGTAGDWYLKNSETSATTADLVGLASIAQTTVVASFNDLSKRLSELHYDSEHNNDVWVRVWNERYTSQPRGGYKTRQDIHGVEGGIDRAVNVSTGQLYVGALVGFGGSQSSNGAAGSSDARNTQIGAYATWLFDNESYVDLVGRYFWFNRDYQFEVNKAPEVGHSRSSALSIDVETGRRFRLDNGWYVEPQAGLNVLSAPSTRFSTSQGNRLEIDNGTQLSSRMSVLVGKTFGGDEITGKPTVGSNWIQAYTRLDWNHRWAGKDQVVVNGTSFDASGGRDRIGLSFGVQKQTENGLFHIEISSSLGNPSVKQEWGINAGARWTF